MKSSVKNERDEVIIEKNKGNKKQYKGTKETK